ncbi:MAG TPA: S8 family serine peptidase, partial [Vicinamibacterales bacterium]
MHAIYATDLAAADLAASADVVRVEADATRSVQAAPSDADYYQQWSLPAIGWDQAFGSVSPAGTSTVAVLDTGVDASHPDFAGQLVPGTSVLDPTSDGTTDPNGHGTWMAGIVAASTDNGIGIAGIGYAGVRVMPVTVLGADGTGSDSDIISGVLYAADHGADVILMSFSNRGYSDALQAAIDYAWSKGAVVVAATGNDGSSTSTFPAGDRGVVGVSSTNFMDSLDLSSNYGADTFLAAPGVGIETTATGGGYATISGTSAAAAEVAGAAALLRANDSSASNGVIVGRLARNADAAGTADQTGNGRLNLARAIADTSLDPVEPVGSPPVGGGGPFVGPYVAAAGNYSYSPTATSLTIAAGGNSNFAQDVTAPKNNGTFTAHLTVSGTGGNPIPASWVSFSPTSSAPQTFVTGGSGGSSATNTWTVTVAVPAATAAGTYTGSLTPVVDSGSGPGNGTPETLTVSVPAAPVITSANNTTFAVGQPGSFTVTATGNPAPTFSEGGALPSGVTFTSAGVLSGTPAGGTAGSYPITITATNSAGTANQSFTLTVKNPASVSSVTPPANGTYRATQNLDFTVNYNENVTVTGTPTIGLTIGATARNASYFSGSGTSALVFRYTVQAGDTDTDGIASASPIVLNGGTIKDVFGYNAALTFTAPNTTGVLVDTTAPTAAITYSPSSFVKQGTSLLITASFSEPLADSPVVKVAISGANTLAAT